MSKITLIIPLYALICFGLILTIPIITEPKITTTNHDIYFFNLDAWLKYPNGTTTTGYLQVWAENVTGAMNLAEQYALNQNASEWSFGMYGQTNDTEGMLMKKCVICGKARNLKPYQTGPNFTIYYAHPECVAKQG